MKDIPERNMKPEKNPPDFFNNSSYFMFYFPQIASKCWFPVTQKCFLMETSWSWGGGWGELIQPQERCRVESVTARTDRQTDRRSGVTTLSAKRPSTEPQEEMGKSQRNRRAWRQVLNFTTYGILIRHQKQNPMGKSVVKDIREEAQLPKKSAPFPQ